MECAILVISPFSPFLRHYPFDCWERSERSKGGMTEEKEKSKESNEKSDKVGRGREAAVPLPTHPGGERKVGWRFEVVCKRVCMCAFLRACVCCDSPPLC